jgi:hypothetical protein
MGTAEQHRAKSDHHLSFLETIPDDFPDWLSTVAFYAAAELIEELAAARDCHSNCHEDRKRFVRDCHGRVYKSFHALYNASLDARYLARERCPTVDEVRGILIGQHLAHVRGYVVEKQPATA